MSLCKQCPRNRSLKQHPWIVNCICSPTRQHKGQTVDHVETRPDGSLVREVTDGQVIIQAVFSTKAVEKLRAELDDSDSYPVEWNQALLLVLEYHAEFRAHKNLAQCEFVLHIDHFKLWDLKEGFFRKQCLVHSDEDARIQKKMKELWEEKQIEWQILEKKKKSKPTGSCPTQQNESTAGMSITQLLEEISKDADDTPTPQDTAKHGTQNMMTGQNSKDLTAQQDTQNRTVEQDTKKELAGKEDDIAVHRKQDKTKKQATQREAVCEGSDTQDLRRPFIISELLIPEQEELILKEIAEWKEGYLPETSVTASSEKASSGDRVESYVPHTLVDDVSSIETTGQLSQPKTGRNECVPKEGRDNQEKCEVSHVPQTPLEEGSYSSSPQQVSRSASKKGHNLSTQKDTSKTSNLPLAENETGLGKTVNLSTNFTNSQLENTSPKTQSSSESLNNSGPFQVCDFLESQEFIPCLSQEKVPNGTSDASRERVTNIADEVSSPQSNKSFEALEVEEERRLEKMATPSKGFCGYRVRMSPRNVNDQKQKGDTHHTKRCADYSEDRPSSVKQKSLTKIVPREETPYSSSQTDSEPDSQVKKRRRLAFSVLKQKGGKGSNKNRTLIGKGISCQPNPDEDAVVIIQSSPESRGVDLDISAAEATSANNTVNETIMVNSSQDSTSSGNSPSVLTYKRKSEDQSIWTSLPSYQPPNSKTQDKSLSSASQSQNLSHPLMDTSLTDKAELLSSLTDMTAPTEPGQKLLELKFCDRLLNQFVDFYTHK